MTGEKSQHSGGRRRFRRIAVEMGAEIVTDQGRFTARTRDLSRGGICFLLFKPLPVGSDFTAELSLLLSDNVVSEPLVITGRVVWCTEVEEGHQIGAAFQIKDATTREYLDAFLRLLAEGVSEEMVDHRTSGDDSGLYV